MALEISLREAFERKPLILQLVGVKHHENSLSYKKNVSEYFQISLRLQFQNEKGMDHKI